MTRVFSVSYFPNIVTVSLMLHPGKVLIEQHESFVKQTYRSRCQILGPNDILTLRVPVKGARKNIPIKEILIDNQQNWQNNHWRSITSAYGKSPFFEHFEEMVKEVIFSSFTTLFDLSVASMKVSLEMIGKTKKLNFTDSFLQSYPPPMQDFRTQLNRKSTLAESDNLTLPSYQQNFGKLFVPNLSVLDVIFCEGPNAINILTPQKGNQ